MTGSLAWLESCKNPLDIKPPFEVPTEEALNTTENLESALNGAYAAAVSTNALGGGLRLLPDIVADHTTANSYAVARGNLPLNLQNAYRRLLFGVADGTWRACYQAINRANNIIDAVDKGLVTDKNAVYQANVNRIKGEALFLRAVMHFELCKMYGVQYGEPGYDDPTGQRGIIISTSASNNRNGAIRNSVKEVYEAVWTDLRQAAALMPSANNMTGFLPTYGGRIGGRSTKEAAWGYMARVFFQAATAEYNDSALVYINKVIPQPTSAAALRPLLDDYTDANGDRLTLSAKNPFNLRGFEAANETIMQVVNTVDEATGTFNASNNLLTNSYVWTASNAQFPSYFLSSIKFRNDAGYAAQADGGSDFRYSFFMQTIPADGSEAVSCRPDRANNLVIAKYFFRTLPAPFDANIGVVNIVLLRKAELMLTRAEINAYKGNLTEALNDINAVRRRGFGVNNTSRDLPSNITQEDLVKRIRQERMRELAFEGDRLYNLRRMARLFENGVPTGVPETRTNFLLTTRTGPGSNDIDRTQCDRVLDNIHVNDGQLLFQIPDAELSSNPNIRRN